MTQVVSYQLSPGFMPAFIEKNYDVVLKGCVDTVESAREFLLADVHNSLGHNEINSQFINLCSRANDIVLTEGIPSMKIIRPEERGMTVSLRTKATIAGWDWPGMENHYSPELKKANALKLKFTVLTERFFISDSRERHRISTELKQVNKVLAEISPAQEELWQREVYQITMKAKDIRTQSMIKSLQACETYSHRFLIAGLAHLDPAFPSAMDRSAFFDFLSKRKAVVLVPKAAEVKIMEQEREARIEQFFQAIRTAQKK